MLVFFQKWVLGNSGSSSWSYGEEYFELREALMILFELFIAELMNVGLVFNKILQMDFIENALSDVDVPGNSQLIEFVIPC